MKGCPSAEKQEADKWGKYLRRESNSYLLFRRELFYPLNYGGGKKKRNASGAEQNLFFC